ncbi:MAG: NADPH-dependent 7-cyano-7-deazaguanine reductase QueF [Bdellovibrionota bacterium]
MSHNSPISDIGQLGLGKVAKYSGRYDPSLLQAVPRSLHRKALAIAQQLPFAGCDVWHGYELSWLNAKGKPVVALARYIFDASSPNIVESKSFKLYLNSFNQTRFASSSEVQELMQKDLSMVSGGKVEIHFFSPQQWQAFPIKPIPGMCLDDLDVEIQHYQLSPELLCVDQTKQQVQETLYSHLLKSNCLVTRQPDWATVVVNYKGQKINHAALLQYLISFRMHDEFHEPCVERIFMDILSQCKPEYLTVQASYTRRGGLDINPFRTSDPTQHPEIYRINRQ